MCRDWRRRVGRLSRHEAGEKIRSMLRRTGSHVSREETGETR